MRQTFDETTDKGFGSRHLPRLKAAMKAQGLDGFLVPHEDEHQNEYLPAANDRLGWLTGFTGSAGAGAVIGERAAVFVDGRYTLQVRQQVDGEIFEYRDLVEGGVPAFILEAAKPGMVIGYDARLHSPDALTSLRAAALKVGANLKAVEPNPLDVAWGEDRPAQPKAQIVPHPVQYTGEDSATKRRRIGESLKAQGAEVTVLTAPHSIAWLLNIRGGDVIRSPLPLGQAIVNADGTTTVFLDPDKVTEGLPAFLGNEVTIAHPDTIEASLKDLKGKKVLIDPAQSSAWWFDRLHDAEAHVIRALDPVALPRACKNAVEIEGSRQAHIRDGVALSRFLHWLDTEAQTTLPDEREITVKLEAAREATGALKDLSFDAIVGAGPHAALPHYRSTTSSNIHVKDGGILLVDSGGQYLDGTTDITRTVSIGTPSAEHRRMFTLVLKGHIAMATVRFPAGTTGTHLDALARLPLWMGGFDYDHGTGHGVGSYLGVHEGPQRIAKALNPHALQPGMIVSNEPGYYKDNDFGIRIEVLQVVTPAAPIAGGERPMLGFEVLTFAPLDRKLINKDLLTADEIAWVNDYHAKVLEKVAPKCDEPIKSWLFEVCKPL